MRRAFESAAVLVVVAAEVVDLAWAQDKDKLSKRSALRLLAGLLDYAATYAQPSDAQGTSAADNAHAQRAKILESLTQDMSDRTGRSGDTVFSLGGREIVAAGGSVLAHLLDLERRGLVERYGETWKGA